MKKINTTMIYIFCALGGLLFGYDTGIISGAILFIKQDMALNALQEGIVVSSILLGAMMGACIITPLSDKYGRRKMLLVCAFVFTSGAIFSAVSLNMFFLTVSRIFLGIAVGGASALVPLYISEMAPTNRRGSLATLNQLMITIGILSAYLVALFYANIANGWRLMIGFAAIPAIVVFLGALFLPESPRWLFEKGRENQSIDVLKRLRINKDNQPDLDLVSKEMNEMKEAISQEKGGFKDLVQKWVRPALVAAIGIAIFQQFIGINTVIYYAPTIFVNLNLGTSSAILSTVGIGILNVLVSMLALYIMDKIDRKKLLIFGSLGMFMSLIILSIFTNIHASTNMLGYITLVSLCLYIFFFALTWGPISWVIIGEVFPLKVRGLGAGVTSLANWFSNLVVALIFPVLFEKFDTYLFLAFACVAILSIFFVKRKVFETRGKSLEEIEIALYKNASFNS
ncbi:MAG: sugar porter family MFS transporter [Endomicrobium sp.]|jgi:sugar porter (SP) family MFS transporter|uniref:sugar porter family MFS transporter n=1 Tax=Candidatus Endomicrobiellum cubanum TaxID=3242325 RepID=UPI00281DAB0F|nr:sugar porter family MFS transporter [Endomicrobium sp.]